jgi:hypothetical protein
MRSVAQAVKSDVEKLWPDRGAKKLRKRVAVITYCFSLNLDFSLMIYFKIYVH